MIGARKQSGQSITEYAILLGVLLVLVLGTIRAIGSFAGVRFQNAAKVLSSTGNE